MFWDGWQAAWETTKHMRGSDVGGSGMGGKPGVHHKIVARRARSIGEMNPQRILSNVA